MADTVASTSRGGIHTSRPRKPSSALTVVVCVFAVGAFLPTRALWIQVPGSLAADLSGHHLDLLGVCLLSNVIAVVYLFIRYCCRRRRDAAMPSSSQMAGADARTIYVSVACGLASLGLLSFSRGSPPVPLPAIARIIPAWADRTAVLIAAGLGSVAASLAAVTYVPFVGNLDNVRSAGGHLVCSVLVGDALSSLLPHALALVQGVGTSSELRVHNDSMTAATVTDADGLIIAEGQNGEPDGYSGSRLLFNGPFYFLLCLSVACFSATCFVVLRCCCVRPDAYAAVERDDTDANSQKTSTSTRQSPGVSLPPAYAAATATTAAAADRLEAAAAAAELSPSTSKQEAMFASPAGVPPSTTVTTVLDDGTERQTTEACKSSVVDGRRASSDGGNRHRRTTPAAVEATPASGAADEGSAARNRRRHMKPLRTRFKSVDVPAVQDGRPKLFRLLIVIVFWASAVAGGPLSTVISYACYPTGSRSFVAGAVVADAVAAVACAVAVRATAGRGDVSTVIAMACLGSIVLIYYLALVVFSFQPQPQPHLSTRSADMPLFGSTAEMLAATAWVTVIGVFSFTRARIGMECHVASADALLIYACAARLGDVIGSTTLIGQVNVCRIFSKHSPQL